MITTEQIIKAAVDKFAVPRKTKYISVGGRNMHVHMAGEKMLFLPNGQTVRVWTDDSGHATQIEEDESLHAIARPDTIKLKLRMQ